MDRLNRSLLPALHVPGLEIGPRQEYPVRVMQFGEGNFLRAFIDWMIDKSNEAGKFNGMVQLVQPLPQGTADLINEQDGLYRPNTNGSSPASRGASRPRPSGTKSSNAPACRHSSSSFRTRPKPESNTGRNSTRRAKLRAPFRQR